MTALESTRQARRSAASSPSSKHVLAVVRSVAHLAYVESVLESLLLRGNRLTLLFDKKWSKEAPTAYLDAFVERWPEVEVGWLRRRKGVLRDVSFSARELRSYGAYIRRLGHDSRYTMRWRQYLPRWAKRACRGEYRLRGYAFDWVMRRRLSDSLFALLERLTPTNPEVLDHLRELAPDVVLVTPANLRFDEEIEYVKAARKQGIPSGIIVVSWDNLTTKGLFHVKPSLLLAWNEAHAAEAVAVHGIAPSRIRVVGAPFFDKWLDRTFEPEARPSFLARVGLAPETPYVLYLGSSKHIAADEGWVVEALADAMDQCDDPTLRHARILVRPHPFNREAHSEPRSERIVVWPDDVRLPEFSSDLRDLVSACAHAICAVGVNTSAMIDAVALDTPTLTVLLDHYAQTQQGTDHFRHLADSGALELADSFDDLARRISAVASGEDRTAEARDRFVTLFLRPGVRTVSAGAVAAEALEWLSASRRT